MRQLYAVLDLKAESLIGGIIQERLDAPAIRAFHDALDSKSNSILSQHPADFSLLLLGTIEEDGRIYPNGDGPQVVATGAQWAAANYLTEEVAK